MLPLRSVIPIKCHHCGSVLPPLLISVDWCLDLDDDVYPNGAVSSLSSEKQMTDSTIVAKKAVATETVTKEVRSASPVAISFKSPRLGDQTHNGTGDGTIVGEKVGLSTSTTTSSPALTFKPDGTTVAAATESIFGSGKSTSLNGSDAAPSLFSYGSSVASSTEVTAIEAPSKDSGKPSSPFSFGGKVVSLKESVADAPTFNFANKSFDKGQQMALTLSSVGAESSGMKFDAASDSKLENSVSSIVTDATGSMPKVPASDNAGAKTNVNSRFFAQASEPAISSAAPTSSLTPPTSIFSLGQSLSQNNSPPASETSFSIFPTSVSNNFTSQNMFSSSSLGANGSSAATAASSSSSMTTSTPLVAFASSTNSTSSSVAATSQTPSFSKFGSSPNLTTDLPSGKQDPGSSTLGNSAFGSSSGAVAGNSIFGYSSSEMTTVNSKSQGSLFGSSTSRPGAQGSASSVFATSTQSHSIPFGSSASSPFSGFSGNTSFSSGSSISPSSSVTDAFSSGTSAGLSTSASPSTANTGSSNGGAASVLFGPSNLQRNKSPFSSTFNSSSPFFSFSPFQFGSQQNIASRSSSPFQASGSLEFNGAGSFSLGTGGGDKSGCKYVKVSKNRARKE